MRASSPCNLGTSTELGGAVEVGRHFQQIHPCLVAIVDIVRVEFGADCPDLCHPWLDCLHIDTPRLSFEIETCDTLFLPHPSAPRCRKGDWTTK